MILAMHPTLSLSIRRYNAAHFSRVRITSADGQMCMTERERFITWRGSLSRSVRSNTNACKELLASAALTLYSGSTIDSLCVAHQRAPTATRHSLVTAVRDKVAYSSAHLRAQRSPGHLARHVPGLRAHAPAVGGTIRALAPPPRVTWHLPIASAIEPPPRAVTAGHSWPGSSRITRIFGRASGPFNCRQQEGARRGSAWSASVLLRVEPCSKRGSLCLNWRTRSTGVRHG